MANITRKIGLSLGADICWPICFEDIVTQLDLALELGGDTVRFEVDRLTIAPFDLQQEVNHDVVVDRLTHWYHPSREWIKKAVIMDGLYVFNNPWSVQSMEKQTTYCALMRLGVPIPKTVLIPPKEYESSPDLEPTLEKYAELFSLEQLADTVGYPSFMKPYDGGGWVGVSKIDDPEAMQAAYDESGKFVMHLQEGIVPYEHFVRCIGLGPQIRVVSYDPSAPLHERYRPDTDFLSAEDVSVLEDLTLTINAMFGWDFNSCEALLKDNVWRPIDFANPCPDSQINSLQFHFPWVVISKIRWALFCAATKRPMRQNLDWQTYWDIAERDLPYRDKLRAYAEQARRHFDSDRFAAFCDQHLSHLDEVARDYFGTPAAKEAIGSKVRAVFPEHEWEEFTERFWTSIQSWREATA